MLTMTVPGKDAGSQFTPAPEGVHPAVCVAIIDLGTQTNEFQGEVKTARQLQIRFELDTDERVGDRPFSVSRTFTASLHPRAGLRQAIEAWFGRTMPEGAFDFAKLLGKGCQIQVVHKVKQNGDTVANIKALMPLAKGMKAPEPSIAPYVFSLDDYDDELFATFSDGMKTWIAKSPEWQRATGRAPAGAKAAKADSKELIAAVAALTPPAPPASPAGFGGQRPKVAPSGRGADFPTHADDLDDEVPF